MNEKYAVGLALISVLAMTLFLNQEKLQSQKIIEAKKAAYQQEISDKQSEDSKRQK